MRTLLILILTISFSLSSYALETVAPYRVSVAATGDVTTDQQRAFEQLIVRITGSRGALSSALVAGASAKEYLQQYSYQSAESGEQLVAVFNETRVNQLLIQAGQRLWGKQRPTLLTWYVIESQGQRHFVSDGSARALAQKQAADQVAIPVRLPVMDLDDSMVVSTGDIWGSFDTNVYHASGRYNTELALLVKQYMSGGEWVNRWRVLDLRQQQGVASGTAKSTAEEVDKVMWRQIADALAGRYAVTQTSHAQDDWLSLTFDNVTSFSEFISLEKELLIHPSVTTVVLKSVREQSYSFEIQLVGSWQDLQTTLDLHKRFLVDAMDPYRYTLIDR